jgi:hypothetical protein
VLILLVLFSLWTLYSHKSGSCSSEGLSGAEWFADKNPQVPVDSELMLLAKNGYQELLNTTSVDHSTKASHKEYVAQSLGKVAGASKATVLDHDLDSNWRGLRRPKNVTPADDALQQYGANDSDFTKGTDLRW